MGDRSVSSDEPAGRSFAGRKILLGVTGSIAAYKAADLCSQLGKRGADVHVVLTASGSKLIGPATLRALTRNPVILDLFDEPQARRIAHIDVAQSSDLVVVAPATANILAKMAHGIADDMLSTCLLATPPTTPILVAPAMNTVMWQHAATQANLETLRARGVHVVEPGHGMLACQDVGVGKLAETDAILDAMESLLFPISDLRGRRVLITAGATREPLDPVRFLSNRSSGKMGFTLAAEALKRGGEVTIVAGFVTARPPEGATVVRVETAEEMLEACRAPFAASDILIAAAAVADYAPAICADRKIKKSDLADSLVLELRRTPDVLATLSAGKRAGQILVGFAAETEQLVANARAKLESKRLDLLVANDVSLPGAGFDADTNIVTLLWPDGRSESLPQQHKADVARAILDAVASLLASRAR
jgi:phosphopantothenoylcysteine decarboxylase/phosphopantothenate--cysteine ligase